MNRGMIEITAQLGGFLADSLGYRQALWIGITGVALAAVGLWISPFRQAVMPSS